MLGMSLSAKAAQVLRAVAGQQHTLAITEHLMKGFGLTEVIVAGGNGEFEGSLADRGLFWHYITSREWGNDVIDLARAFFETHGGGTYLDIGANIGLTAVPLASLPNVVIHAFEPHPENFKRLQMNVARNCVQDNVVLHQMALGKEKGTVSLWRDARNFGDARMVSADRSTGGGEEIQVEVRGFDELDLALRHPVFAKVDIQGWEPAFIAGATNLLAEASAVFMEFWPSEMTKNGFDWEKNLREILAIFPNFNAYRLGKRLDYGNIQEAISGLKANSQDNPHYFIDLYLTK